MYVHCHNCGWQQDDFYDESYNPAKFLSREYDRELFGNDCNKLKDLVKTMDGKEIIAQENIARWYEHFAKNIRNMRWTTSEQFYNDPNKICPKCGSDKLDLD